MKLSIRYALLAVIATTAVASTAEAQGVNFWISQVGNDVVMTGQGSYDLTGATLLGGGSQEGFISGKALAVGTPFQDILRYGMTVNPGLFGTGSFQFASSLSGQVFGLDAFNGFITVPVGYVSGAALNGTATFANKTLASLGLTSGTWKYELPNTSATVTVTPEPATLGLLAVGMLFIGVGARRRKSTRV